jgi:hypothetical protein
MPVLEVAESVGGIERCGDALDEQLQAFFAAYLKRPKREQVDQPAHGADDDYGSGREPLRRAGERPRARR